jgi:hypothetical protein
MAGLETGNLGSPDETRPFAAKGRAEVVTLGGRPSRAARSSRAGAGRSSQADRPDRLVPGRAQRLRRLRADAHQDGRRDRARGGPRRPFVCAPGHDAWTLGDEPCIVVDFTAPQYAKPS